MLWSACGIGHVVSIDMSENNIDEIGFYRHIVAGAKDAKNAENADQRY